MGQEQSQDPQESQSDPVEPSQPDTTNNRRSRPKSPDTERKPQRGLWRDGGSIGSRMGSPPHGAETIAKAVWYQGENLDQGTSEDWNRKEENSQSVWYDIDTTDQRKQEQVEQKDCDLSSAQASGLSSPQLLEQGLSSHQLSAALNQPHAAGTQPALSHGPGAQRREVHRSQQEEEVGPDWKEGGVEGDGDRDGEEVSNRETTYSRKSSETADIEEGCREKQRSEKKGAKGRKKRKKKRGKRGGAEAKLSSSSSIESPTQIEIKTQREQVTNLDPQSETGSEAKEQTGRANVQEADKDTLHLPSQTESQNRDTHRPDCGVTNLDVSSMMPEFSLTQNGRTNRTEVPASQKLETKELLEDGMTFHGPDHFNSDSTATASEFGQLDIIKADIEEIKTVQQVKQEVPDPTELELTGLASPVQQTVDSKTFDLTVAGKSVPSVEWTGWVESNCPKELPVKFSDPTEFTEDLFLVEFPEQYTQHVQNVESNILSQPVDPMGTPTGFMESVHPMEAGGLPFKGTVDVLLLQIQEGRAETTSETLRDQQHEEEKRNELWMGEEEARKKRSRSEENDSGMVHGKELSSIDREQEHKYTEDLVATAVAVVAVAIASAMASIELSQLLADNQSESQESLKQLADTQLFAMTVAETANQTIKPTDQLTFKEQANVALSEESDSIVLQFNTETEQLAAAQLSSNQQANLDLSALADTLSLPQPDKEEIHTENTNKIFTCSQPREEDSLLHVHMKPLAEANEMITPEVNSPVSEPGKHPEETFYPSAEEKHRDTQDQSVCQEESRIQHRHDGDDSHPLTSVTAEGEAGREAQEQDSPHSSECEECVLDCQAEERERDPQLDGQVERGEIHTLTPSVTLCDSTHMVHPSPEGPTAPVNVETGQYQSTQSLPDMKPVPAIPLGAGSSTFQDKGHIAMDNEVGVFEGRDKESDALDTVDGWKERENNKMKHEDGSRKEMVKSQTGKYYEYMTALFLLCVS